jgi:hypothetical protein
MNSRKEAHGAAIEERQVVSGAPFPAIDPPPGTANDGGGQPSEAEPELTPVERDQCQRLVDGFREAQRGQNANWRYEKLVALLEKIEAGEDHEALWHHAYQQEKLLHPVACMKTTAKVVTLALKIAMGEVRETLDPAEELKRMEEAVREVVIHLGAKARTVLGVLEQIAHLEGLSIGIDFGREIIDGEIEDEEAIGRFCEELAADGDILVMARAHELALKIEKRER